MFWEHGGKVSNPILMGKDSQGRPPRGNYANFLFKTKYDLGIKVRGREFQDYEEACAKTWKHEKIW